MWPDPSHHNSWAPSHGPHSGRRGNRAGDAINTAVMCNAKAVCLCFQGAVALRSRPHAQESNFFRAITRPSCPRLAVALSFQEATFDICTDLSERALLSQGFYVM